MYFCGHMENKVISGDIYNFSDDNADFACIRGGMNFLFTTT